MDPTKRVLMALVRHGDYAQPAGVPSAWLPHALTDLGREQAREAADDLVAITEREGVSLHPVIDASSLRRAWETATLLAEALSARLERAFEVEQFGALAERSLGAFANLTVDQIERFVADDPRCEPLPPKWKRSSEFRLPTLGAESLMQAGHRVREHIERRLAELEPGRLEVFVGHGGSLRHAAHAMGILEREEISSLSMYHARPVVFERAATGWTRIAGEWKPRSRGDAAD